MPNEERLKNLEAFAAQAADLLNDLNERLTIMQKAMAAPVPGVIIREADIIKVMEVDGISWEEAKEKIINERPES